MFKVYMTCQGKMDGQSLLRLQFAFDRKAKLILACTIYRLPKDNLHPERKLIIISKK